MSVFNRKLFTHTPYHHYGTGIASGLVERQGFAVGGRVKLSKGGDSSFDAQAALDQQRAETDKAQLFKGNETINPGGVGLSVIGRAYQIKFNEFLKKAGITPEQYKEFSKENKQKLAETINDQVVSSLVTQFNVDYKDIEKAFGGETGEKGQSKMIKQSLRAIDQTYSQGLISDDEFLMEQQTKLNDRLAEIEENFPTAREPLPDVKKIKVEQEKLVPPPNEKKEGLAAIAEDSLMGMDQTTDEFRKEYMDNLLESQAELGLADTRKRQALTKTALGIGAADPVQKGQSLTQMIAKSFQDPMAELYAAENVRAEDVYKRYADRTDKAYDPSDSREVQLAKYFMSTGMSQEEANSIISGMGSQQQALVRELINNEEVSMAVQTRMSETGQSYPEAFESITGESLGGKTDLNKKTITAETLTAPDNAVLANGGRVGLQTGGDPAMEMAAQADTSLTDQGTPTIEPMSFEELREKLPDYISDDVVQLLADNPQALMELAQAQTERELNMFEKKYNVQVTMPLAEDEATTDGMF